MTYLSTISLGLVFGFSILVLHEVFSAPYWKIGIYALVGVGIWTIVGVVGKHLERQRSEINKRREARAFRQKYREWEQ